MKTCDYQEVMLRYAEKIAREFANEELDDMHDTLQDMHIYHQVAIKEWDVDSAFDYIADALDSSSPDLGMTYNALNFLKNEVKRLQGDTK